MYIVGDKILYIFIMTGRVNSPCGICDIAREELTHPVVYVI